MKRNSAALRLRELLPTILLSTPEDNSTETTSEELLKGSSSPVNREVVDVEPVTRLDNLLKCSHWATPSVPEAIQAAGSTGTDRWDGWRTFAVKYGLPADAVQAPEIFLGMVLHALLLRSVKGESLQEWAVQSDQGQQKNVVDASIELLVSFQPSEVVETLNVVFETAPRTLQHLRAAVATCLLSHAARGYTSVGIDDQVVDFMVCSVSTGMNVCCGAQT